MIFFFIPHTPLYRRDKNWDRNTVRPAIVSGMVTGDAPVSYWPNFFPDFPTVPKVFANVYSEWWRIQSDPTTAGHYQSQLSILRRVFL